MKLQASFNRLGSLPRQLCALPRLELMRVAVNNIAEVCTQPGMRILCMPPPPLSACMHAASLDRAMHEGTHLHIRAALNAAVNGIMHGMTVQPYLREADIAACPCCLLQVPQELASCPSLAWMSLGGNPACAEAPPPRSQIRTLTMDQLDLGRPLGDGASGDVFAAMLVCAAG